MSRPCFCSLANNTARQLCPVHFFWPIIVKNTRSGEKLFPTFYGTKVNNTLKAILAKIKIEHAKSYTSHGFRRGAANELKTRGSQWSTIATLGEWRSLAFRGYVDIAAELDRDMSKLLAETNDLESDIDEEVRSLGADRRINSSDFGCL